MNDTTEKMAGLLREAYPHVCARRDEQDLDVPAQRALAEKLQDLIDRTDVALSQQAEPAPAQDEQEIWSGALLQVAVVLEALRSSDSATRLANMDAGKVLGEAYAKLKHIRTTLTTLTTRPAQTEQQPIGFRDPSMGWATISAENKARHLASEESWQRASVASFTVPIYAAPIAQTAPQPEQDEQEAFEVWLCTNHGYLPYTLRSLRSGDSYQGVSLPLAWSAWNAAIPAKQASGE